MSKGYEIDGDRLSDVLALFQAAVMIGAQDAKNRPGKGPWPEDKSWALVLWMAAGKPPGQIPSWRARIGLRSDCRTVYLRTFKQMQATRADLAAEKQCPDCIDGPPSWDDSGNKCGNCGRVF